MGKKTKTGKHRQDVFYKKAKEAGYRARAAFKLIQLNSKFEFLSKSKVCVDLCAAPGSWMQVARKYMPPSSVIVGVDLVPIKNIPNTLSIIGDITTEKVRQELRATLKTWKADLVLHDGAPNIGQNWIHDAYQQNLLVLHSFRLACELLQKGGNFVTKVFRSKDYFSLEYVFRKLFKKVEATKPQASRYESAEIFVVCQGYLAPDKVDPEFFDAKSVFQEVDTEPTDKINLLKPDKVRRKALGYEEGITTLYKPVPVSKFMETSEYLTVLQEASALIFDTEEYLKYPYTTDEIKEYCVDIKVLGRRELRMILNWRKRIRAEINEANEKKKQQELEDKKMKGEAVEEEEEHDELDKLDEIQKQVEEIKAENARTDKRARRKVEKSKRKLDERMKLKLMVPGDAGPTEKRSDGLFNLKTLDKVQSLDTVVDQVADEIIESSSDEEMDDDFGLSNQQIKVMKYSKDSHDTYLDSAGRYYKTGDETDSDEEPPSEDSDCENLGIKEDDKQSKKKSVSFAEDVGGDSDDDGEVGENNPLVTDLVGDTREARRERKAENWFTKDIFKDIETEADEDFELETALSVYEKKGGKIRKKEVKDVPAAPLDNGYHSSASDVEKATDAPVSDEDSDSDSDSDSEEEKELVKEGPQFIGGSLGNGITSYSTNKGNKKGKKRGLDAVGKALATKMIHSKKAKRDIMDAAWNRYMYGDENLPDWFEKDEEKHNRPRVEVDPVDLRMYKNEGKSVDARSIKKVIEAKARKQRRMKKRLEKAKRKAENVTNNADMNSQEKASELKTIYKKALAPMKKRDKTYVVMKKSYKGRKPEETKGPYKMVDKRLKKDTKSQLRAREKKMKNKNKRRR